MTSCVCRFQGVTGGVLRGAGKQLVGALCNLVGHYFIGFPIGVSLMFAANMGIMGKRNIFLHWKRWLLLKRHIDEFTLVVSVKGLWTGLTICVLMQSMFFLVYLAKLDWKKAADDVRIPAANQNCPQFLSLSDEPGFKFRSSFVLPISQAMIRAGVKTKEETKMSRIKSKGNFNVPYYIH